MSLTSAFSRDQLRQAYSDAWRRHLDRVPLAPQEAAIADVIALHPEYHALVADAQAALAFEPGADTGQVNPFLHLGLHLAVREQVAIDRPPGIRALHQQLQTTHGGIHGAEHVLMDALGHVLWQAQREGKAPDEQHYLALARRRAGA